MLNKKFDFEKIDEKTAKANTRFGVKVTIYLQFFKLMLQLLSIYMLARLLKPEDYGSYALVISITGVVDILRDGGLSKATMQAKEISENQLSTLYWTNIVIGVVLGFCAILLIWMFGGDLVKDIEIIGVVVGLSFLFNAMQVQYRAILLREMRFAVLLLIDFLSNIISLGVTVVLAYSGFGYWSLLSTAVVAGLMQLIAILIYVQWRPRFHFDYMEVRHLINFGTNLTVANFFGYLSNSVVPLSVGRLGGLEVLGYFNRAISIYSIPISQILNPLNNVLQSTLIHSYHKTKDFEVRLMLVMRNLLLPMAFISLFCFFKSELIVDVLLGKDWAEVVPIFKIMAVAGFLEPLACIFATALIATGQAYQMLKWKIFHFLLVAFSAVVGYLIGGVYGIVICYVIGGGVEKVIFIKYVSRLLKISIVVILKNIFSVVCVVIICGIAFCNLDLSYEVDFRFKLMLDLIIAGGLYIGVCMLFPVLRNDIFRLLEAARSKV